MPFTLKYREPIILISESESNRYRRLNVNLCDDCKSCVRISIKSSAEIVSSGPDIFSNSSLRRFVIRHVYYIPRPLIFGIKSSDIGFSNILWGCVERWPACFAAAIYRIDLINFTLIKVLLFLPICLHTTILDQLCHIIIAEMDGFAKCLSDS